MKENNREQMNGRVTRKRMRLTDLKPHPLQSLIYTPCSKAEDEALADSLRRDGQREPIVVMPSNNKAGLPDGTILDGDRRRQRLLANGETEANVLVRDDLKDAAEETITEAFLSYNFHRRHLDKLDRARVVQHLFMTKQNVPLERLDVWKRGELRERIGKTLGMSGRTLDRYLRVLETPIEVQTAFTAKRLKLVPAGQIAGLSKEEQDEFVAKLQALPPGTKANELAKEYINANESRQRRQVCDDLVAFARHVDSAWQALADRLDEVRPEQARKYVPIMKNGIKLIQKLLRMT